FPALRRCGCLRRVCGPGRCRERDGCRRRRGQHGWHRRDRGGRCLRDADAGTGAVDLECVDATLVDRSDQSLEEVEVHHQLDLTAPLLRLAVAAGRALLLSALRGHDWLLTARRPPTPAPPPGPACPPARESRARSLPGRNPG